MIFLKHVLYIIHVLYMIWYAYKRYINKYYNLCTKKWWSNRVQSLLRSIQPPNGRSHVLFSRQFGLLELSLNGPSLTSVIGEAHSEIHRLFSQKSIPSPPIPRCVSVDDAVHPLLTTRRFPAAKRNSRSSLVERWCRGQYRLTWRNWHLGGLQGWPPNDRYKRSL